MSLTPEEKLQLHRQRPEAFVPEDIGVEVPLPTGPERLEQIRARLENVCMIPLPTGETGWQVYEQATVSTGKMEKIYAEQGRTDPFTPPSELTIYTAYNHGQLKAPASVVSRMCGPFQYPEDLSSLRRKDATFIAHAPADMAYLLERLEESQIPPLRPMFQRLAELSPDWVMKGPSPCYKDGVTEWAIDGASTCDADWMHAHTSLRRSVIDTIAELGWAFYTVRPKGGVLVQREGIVRRGKLAYEERDFGQLEEVWILYGEHRAKGPTDLHALLAALIEALEAHAKAEGEADA